MFFVNEKKEILNRIWTHKTLVSQFLIWKMNENPNENIVNVRQRVRAIEGESYPAKTHVKPAVATVYDNKNIKYFNS